MGLHAYVDSDDYRNDRHGTPEHCFWSAPYSSFNDMRVAIARAAGWPLRPSDYRKGEYHPSVDGDWTPENFRGEWAETPEEILTVLFVHSDCGGRIDYRHSQALADRLEGLKAMVFENLHDIQTEDFESMITALRASAEIERDIVFG